MGPTGSGKSMPSRPVPKETVKQRSENDKKTTAAAATNSTTCKRVDRIGGGDLWLWRADAVRRLTESHLKASSGKELRRRIWTFLDDRPRCVATGCADGQARMYDLRSSSTRPLVSVRHDPSAREPVQTL